MCNIYKTSVDSFSFESYNEIARSEMTWRKKRMEKEIVYLKEVVTMKAFNMSNVDVHQFMQALDSCSGDVMLITDEGDKFNLKSKLSQITGLMKLIEGGKLVSAKIYCSNQEDEALLFRLNLFGTVEDVENIG
jgi:hypothetical protein